MSHQNLLSPVQVGNNALPNRIGMSALTRNRAANTYPTKLMKRYYMQRAFGGAGLIISESIMISRQGWQWSNVPGIWDEHHISGWRDITDAVHHAGGKIFAQLGDAGRLAHPDAPQQKLSGEPVYAPSPVPAKGGKFRQIPGEPGFVTPTAISDPRVLVDRYRRAAINARKAGFDGVELQASAGVLPAQFLDSNSNKRDDQWGGSVENRARFGLEVLKALKEVFGADVGLKVSPGGGHNDMGMPLEETLQTYTHFLGQADKMKLAYITLVRYDAKLDAFLNNGKPRGTKHDVLQSYKPYIRQSKLFLNQGVTPEEGESLIKSGEIDGIFISAKWVSHPDLVHRVRNRIPLNVPANPADFYGAEDKDEASWETGYVDYPKAGY